MLPRRYSSHRACRRNPWAAICRRDEGGYQCGRVCRQRQSLSPQAYRRSSSIPRQGHEPLSRALRGTVKRSWDQRQSNRKPRGLMAFAGLQRCGSTARDWLSAQATPRLGRLRSESLDLSSRTSRVINPAARTDAALFAMVHVKGEPGDLRRVGRCWPKLLGTVWRICRRWRASYFIGHAVSTG